MPTSKLRKRVEVRADLYDRLQAVAKREGYPSVARFHDHLLEWALDTYAAERLKGHHPMAERAMRWFRSKVRWRHP